MANWYAQRRVLGRTNLNVPRVVFGTAALGNVGRVMTDQAKLAFCGEFLRQVALPVWIETSNSYGDGMALEVLGRVLRRLEVGSDEVVIQLTIDAYHASSIAECWEKSCRLLGDEFRPKLIAIEDVDDAGVKFVGDLKATGDVRGVGLVATDWRRAKNSLADFDADWVMISGCTVMRHSNDVLEFMAELAMNETPIVLSGVFEGGFLVGRNQLDGCTLQAENPSHRSRLALAEGVRGGLCDGHGISPSHACIRFALAAPGVDAVRLETSYTDRVVQNVSSISERLPENFWQSMIEEGLLAGQRCADSANAVRSSRECGSVWRALLTLKGFLSVLEVYLKPVMAK